MFKNPYKNAECYYDEDGLLHRDDGPAVINSETKTVLWFKHGLLHRDNGPAKISIAPYTAGSEKWFQNGVLHRDGAPAIEQSDGTKKWFSHGKIHRLDGPAIEYADGGKEYWIDGSPHREDGPAVDKPNLQMWIYKGKLHRPNDEPAIISYDIGNWGLSFPKYSRRISLYPQLQSHEKQWWENGLLHRNGGPAIISEHGEKRWFQNGYLHRIDGPAIEYLNGSYQWWKNGKLHRKNGPAIAAQKGFFLFGHGIGSKSIKSWVYPSSYINLQEINLALLNSFELRKTYIAAKRIPASVNESDRVQIKRRDVYAKKRTKLALLLCDLKDKFAPLYLNKEPPLPRYEEARIEEEAFYPYAHEAFRIMGQEYWVKGKFIKNSL